MEFSKTWWDLSAWNSQRHGILKDMVRPECLEFSEGHSMSERRHTGLTHVHSHIHNMTAHAHVKEACLQQAGVPWMPCSSN
eukprot:1159078-Pelagomonas_calceolata.AAC.1